MILSVCLECNKEMKARWPGGRIGVLAIEVAGNPPTPCRVWHADLVVCPGCGRKSLGGFPHMPLPVHKPREIRILIRDQLDENLPVFVFGDGTKDLTAADLIGGDD